MIDISENNRYNILDFGVWRSLVSRLVRVQEASGSNPDTPTIEKHWKCMFPVLFLTFYRVFKQVLSFCLPLFYHFAGLCRTEPCGDGIRHVGFSGGVQVGVDVGGHLDIRVSQPFLHILEGEAHVNEETCTGVPQLVEADVGKTVLFQKPVESVADVVRGVGVAVCPFEDIVVFLILPAKGCPVLLLQLLGSPEDGLCFFGEGEGSPAAGVLGLVLGDHFRDLGDGVPDGHGLPLKVDAVPLKPQKLAPAQSIQGGDFHQRQKLVPLQGREQVLKLSCGVEGAFIAHILGQLHELAGIGGNELGLHGEVEGLADDVLVQPQGAGRQTALSIQPSALVLLVHVPLNHGMVEAAEGNLLLVEVGEYVAVCEGLVALHGHFIHLPGDVGEPVPDIVGKEDVRLHDALQPLVFGDFLPQEGFCLALVALFGKAGVNPFLLAFAVLVDVENGVVFTVFDGQAACHPLLLSVTVDYS